MKRTLRGRAGSARAVRDLYTLKVKNLPACFHKFQKPIAEAARASSSSCDARLSQPEQPERLPLLLVQYTKYGAITGGSQKGVKSPKHHIPFAFAFVGETARFVCRYLVNYNPSER